MAPATILYSDEKVPEVYVLPAPVPAAQPKRRSLIARIFRGALIFVFASMLFNGAFHGLRNLSRGCHRHQMPLDFGPMDDGQHPFPPVDEWKSFKGTTRFEFDPAVAAGFAVKGTQNFGSVIFETSKLSDKVVIDLDIKTKHKDKHDDITVTEENGFLTINTPSTGKLETYAAAKILIPSNIIGSFGMPQFQVDVPQHMIDYSKLPESLEIGALTIHAANGFIQPGPVHTNTTTLSIANGLVRGSLKHARYETSIDVAHGDVSLNIPAISSGNQGVTKIHLGNGKLNGTFAIYNSSTIDVASGEIYINVAFKHSCSRASLSTKIASGNSRVYVDSIASDRLLEATHTSINGDQLITYPGDFQGTIDARGVIGDIKLAGEGVEVEKVLGGLVGRKGDSERNSISVKTVKGELDILVGDK